MLICIGENYLAMPEKRAVQIHHNRLEIGSSKETYQVIPEEVNQYRKFDVFGVIESRISSDLPSGA